VIVCKKCGLQNPLGRVFCQGCGSKLDLAHVGTDTVAAMTRPAGRAGGWVKIAAWTVGALLALSVVLALWPNARPIGDRGNRPGGLRLQNQLRVVSTLRAGQKVDITMKEADLNAFIEHFKVQGTDIASLSASLRPGRIDVRMVRPLWRMDVKTFRLEPRVSIDLVLSPAGRGLRVRGASVGHLPLFGPLRTMAVRRVYGRVSVQKEWRDTAACAEKVETGNGTLTLSVGK
jgi:hypothetical protein